MYIKGLLIMVVFLQTAASEEEPGDVFYELVCEDEDMHLKCPKGYTIEILFAMFGKKNYKICYQPGIQIENCEAKNASIIAQNKCNLRQQCYLSADTDLFGDPCGEDTHKYLDVAYRCLKNNNIVSFTICEHERFTIECPLANRIKIVNAFYGRKNGITCTNHNTGHDSLKCDSKTALEIVASNCDHSKKCSVTVNNELFGDPCIPETFKYFELDYLCIEGIRNISCEHETMSLSCERGYINILDAFFGKKENTRTYCSIWSEKVSNCEAWKTLDIMKYKCDFKRNCQVEADVRVFGDRCPETNKYLDVTYECVDAPTYSAIACEYDQLQISCPDGQFLWIVDALFGREHPTICYKPPRAVVNNVCRANIGFDVVESRFLFSVIYY
uniref:Putative galactoside-binding lectin n=1 Tax=Panstrongylus lignarius TaxID=156445 RepID=A0A224XE34_9HEMI